MSYFLSRNLVRHLAIITYLTGILFTQSPSEIAYVSATSDPVIYSISTGTSNSCALTNTGAVKCWGINSLIPVDIPGLSENVTAISSGNAHNCAVLTNGTVKCWGDNNYGQLGDGTTYDRDFPVEVVGLSGSVQQISAGATHTCALLNDGMVQCWGNNMWGMLGNNTNNNSTVPVNVYGLTPGNIALSASGYNTCVITSLGAVKCWGRNDLGQLGDGTTTIRYTPVDVFGLTNGMNMVSMGRMHACALTSNGAAKCWGSPYWGQLGSINTQDPPYTPVDVYGLSSGVTSITSGDSHSCASTMDGQVKCWGLNASGCVGDGTAERRDLPVNVSGLTNVSTVSAGSQHTCALKTNGSVNCWGWNSNGQLGDGTTIDRYTPVPVVGLNGSPMSVSHIEVTQAIQGEVNTGPVDQAALLIANRWTFARVYINCGEGCSSIPNVTGTLSAFRDGVQIGKAIQPVNLSVTAKNQEWTEQRGDLRDTLNFTLPMEWVSNGEITLRADVQGNSFSESISFNNAEPIKIAIVKIRENRGLLGEFEPSKSEIENADYLLRKLTPTNSITYYELPETFEWRVPMYCELLPDTNLQKTNCYDEDLTNKLNRFFKQSYGDFLFGWLPKDTVFTRSGSSDPEWAPGGNGQGHIAFGKASSNYIIRNRNIAHEIGHMLGANHTGIFDDIEVGDPDYWPYQTALIQEWGVDGYGFGWLGSSNSALHDPSVTYDYMSYETWDQSTTWVSPFTWNKTYTFKLQPGVLSPAKNSVEVEQPYLDVSALVFSDDMVSVDPIWVITSSSQDTLPVGTNYCLETQDASTNLLSRSCFDLDFIDYETGTTTNVDGFRTMLPYSETVKRIVLKKGTTELFVMTVSPNPPTITLTSPNGGETWATSGAQTITWSASDLDGDTLTYNVDYSVDGINWLPVGSNLTDPQVEIDAADLPGSATARVRVTATDGINTVSDQSDAVFSVAEKGPRAQIYSPEKSPITVGSGLVLLQGSGYDLEDGSLSDTSLSWTSNLDGALGTGPIVQPNLTPGSHTITLTATDSDGNSGSTATVINVATCYMLTVTHSGSGDDPVATPGYSSVCPTGYYLEGESISFSGANPDVGWLISGWTGTNNNSSTETNNTLTMPANHQVAAVIYSPDLVPPTLPTLVSPAANAEVRGTPEYSWNGSADSAAYFFQYDTNSDFSSPEFTSDEISSNTFTPPTQIPGVYYWHVKARDAVGNWSNWSDSRAITIKPLIPVAPVLVSPATGKFTNDNTPTFTWKSVPDGYKYRIQLSKISTFTSPVFKNIVLSPGVLTFTAPKLADGKYFWRVMAINLLDEGKNWSVVRNFTVDTVKPAAPLLSSPANNATVTGIPTYKWQTVSGAKYYQLSYATNSTFTNGVFTSAKLTVLSFKPVSQPKGTFYWRVRSQDAAGNWSSWSLVRKVILK